MATTRYNNPGNIEVGQKYAGETGETYADRFAVFDSPEMGIRALARDLRTKINRHKGDISKIINQYAPRSENPATYEKYLKSKVGDTVTDKEFPDLVRAIIQFENKPEVAAEYLDPKIFNEGIKLSEVSLPYGTFLEEARNIVYGTGRPQLASDMVGLTGVPRDKPRLQIPELEGSENASVMDLVPDISGLVSGIRGLLGLR